MAMPLWNDFTPKSFGYANPQSQESINARQPGENLVGERAVNRPVASDLGEETHGSGTLTKYRPTSGWGTAGRNLVASAARGSELGEPTSFNAGAGAPESVGVIRGNTMTFSAGRVPGEQFARPEVATDLQARQDFNRVQRGQFMAANPTRENLTYPAGTSPEEQATKRYGTYEGPGTNLMQQRVAGMREANAAENKAPERVAAADTIRQQQEQKEKEMAGVEFDKLLQGSQYSSFDPAKGVLAFRPKDEHMARDQVAARNIAIAQKSGDAGVKHFQERQNIRNWLLTQPLQPGFNVNAFLDAAAANPEHWQGLVNDAKKVAGPRPVATGVPPGSVMAAGETPMFPQ